MRLARLLGTMALGLGLAIVTHANDARAGDGYDAPSVSHTKISVSPSKGYHINAEYPWKLVTKDKDAKVVAAKDRFTLSDASAVLNNPPTGTYVLKGAVCANDGGACKPFQETVSVP